MKTAVNKRIAILYSVEYNYIIKYKERFPVWLPLKN